MSKYVEVETKFKDKECLLSALKSLGFNDIKQGQNIPLKAYNDRDRYDKNGQIQTAEIVIEKKHIGSVSNDLGFKFTQGHYKMLISDMDVNSKTLNPANVKKAYAEATINKYTKRLGFNIVSTKVVDGKRKIMTRRW